MLILASASPTRRQLLENAGLNFEVKPASINERALAQGVDSDTTNNPAGALKLAEAKAMSVSQDESAALIIGADQTLIHNGHALHKPDDMNAAKAQLQQLCGSSHHLYAAVTLVRDGRLIWSHVATAKLTMRRFSEVELQAVLDEEGTRLLSSVGSYRLEGPSIRLFDRIEGDYFTILGLPLLPLLKALREQGFPS